MSTPDENVHPQASGEALKTAQAHEGHQDLVLYGSWFCPFVQRAWIALEEKGVPYQYIEVNPYKKPPELLKVNPRGLVPGITHHGEGIYESTVLVEYINEAFPEAVPLLPKDAMGRAKCRIWIDHCNTRINPAFYRYLQAQEKETQDKAEKELLGHLATFRDAMKPAGPFFLGEDFTIVDIALVPWILRLESVLHKYRGFEIPQTKEWGRFNEWMSAVMKRPSVLRTSSEEHMYLQVYERYAHNTAQSEVAKATRAGKNLP